MLISNWYYRLLALQGNKWWTKSDEPWQTLAACKEVAAALELPDPHQYVCHLPIHQDGSCNGLQHYAALGRDKIGAISVNLTPSERPQDLYSNVAALVKIALQPHFYSFVTLCYALWTNYSFK